MKQMAIQMITEALACGARRHKACGVLGISCRTLRRWSEPSHELSDRRGQAARGRVHPQALTPEEKQAIVQACNTPEHARARQFAAFANRAPLGRPGAIPGL